MRFILVLFAIFSVSVCAAEVVTTPAKVSTCAACHGVDGNSPSEAFPSIARQNEKYLIAQLNAYRKGNAGGRSNPVMVGMVAGLTEEEIVELAHYYALQKPTLMYAKDEKIKLGQTLYKGGKLSNHIPACSACHGPEGLGNAEAGYPRLGGQYKAYTVAQLMAYKNKSRHNPGASTMQMIAAKMSPEEMQAVANYIQGLH